jgi:hypothetical protein
MMQQFLQTFTLNENDDGGDGKQPGEQVMLPAAGGGAPALAAGGGAAAAPTPTLAPAPALTTNIEPTSMHTSFPGNIEPYLATSVQDLFDSVYSPGGAYNQFFRQELQTLVHAHTEQLRTGKNFYDAMMLVGISSPDSEPALIKTKEVAMYLASEGALLLLLQPFMELASEQLRGICELHSDDILRWLAQSSLSDRKGRGRGALQEREIVLEPLTGSSSGVGTSLPAHSPVADDAGRDRDGDRERGPLDPPLFLGQTAIVEFLNHIGRIDPDLVFLAKLAEISDSCGWQARTDHANEKERGEGAYGASPEPALAEVFPAMGVSDFFAQLLNDSEALHSPHLKCAKMLGTWEICDKQNFDNYGRFLAAVGYPWFLRQFLGRAMSCMTIVDAVDQGVVVSACGSFLGYNMENINKRMPPMVFRHQHVATDGPVWQLVGRPPGKSSVAKLCYRFVNTHASIVSSDGGSFVTDMIHYNPRQFFAAGTSMQQVFDFDEMRGWLGHLSDVDSIGLPKAMVRTHWDRRLLTATHAQRGNVAYLDWELAVYEYDSATQDWSNLRRTCRVSYTLAANQQPPAEAAAAGGTFGMEVDGRGGMGMGMGSDEALAGLRSAYAAPTT